MQLIGWLPLSASRLLAKIISKVLVRLPNNKVVKTSRANLKTVYPALCENKLFNQSKDELLERSIYHTIANSLEMPAIWTHDNNWINTKIISIQDSQILQDALNKKKGVVVICPHIGNWEVFGRQLPKYAATTNLYQPPKRPELEDVVRSGRELSGAKLVPTNQRGVAKILKALKNGEITGILPDQVPPESSGQFADFFGQPAFTMTMIFNLVKKTQCNVVLGYAIRQDKGFIIKFKSPPEAIYSTEETVALNALNEMVEMAVRDAPEQYLWAYKRFKRHPKNLDIYK